MTANGRSFIYEGKDTSGHFWGIKDCDGTPLKHKYHFKEHDVLSEKLAMQLAMAYSKGYCDGKASKKA